MTIDHNFLKNKLSAPFAELRDSAAKLIGTGARLCERPDELSGSISPAGEPMDDLSSRFG